MKTIIPLKEIFLDIMRRRLIFDNNSLHKVASNNCDGHFSWKYIKSIKFFNDIQGLEYNRRVDIELRLDGLDPRSKMNTNTEAQPRNVEGYTLSPKEQKVVTQCNKVCTRTNNVSRTRVNF